MSRSNVGLENPSVTHSDHLQLQTRSYLPLLKSWTADNALKEHGCPFLLAYFVNFHLNQQSES